jgi:hypothetical protein
LLFANFEQEEESENERGDRERRKEKVDDLLPKLLMQR